MAKRTTGRAVAAAPTQQLRTADSFQNFIARVGQGTGNQADGAHYGFNPVTRNRLQMEWVYRGSWVAGRVVDCVARDMTREGIDINTSADSVDIKQFDKGLARMKVWSQLCENIKWARLYGGSCAFIMIDGQDPKTPLKPERIGKGQFKGLLPMDRWLLQPSLQELIEDYGPTFGKPKFYQTVPDSMGMPLMTIHHSRMVRLEGVELPYWQRISENLWGQSVLERMWDRLLAFDSTTTGIAQLVYKAHLRTLSIESLRDYIGQGGKAMNGVLAQINMIRAMQTNEGMTVIDATDKFETHSYTFAGLDNVLVQFGEQLCGAVEIPAVRLFGQSPAGFNSGDSDLRSYYDSIKQNQEADLGPQIETLYRVAWLSEFGSEPPEKSFDLEFEHLWQMDEEQKATVGKTTEEAISDAYEKQIIDRATAMRELKKLGREVGTFSLIEEEAITEAEADPAPTPEALGLVAPEPEPGAGSDGNEPPKDPNEYKPNDAKPFKALDAAGDIPPRHEESGRFTHGMGLDPKRFDEKGKKDDDGEWAENPLNAVKTKSIREAVQAAHPHTCKAYGELGEIEPWKLQSHQKLVNIKKVGAYRRDHGEPITAVKRAGEYGIVDGHHRAVAAHLQGRNVAANIVDMDRAFAEADDAEATSPGLGVLGALHLATQLRLKNTPTPKRTKDSVLRRLLRLLSPRPTVASLAQALDAAFEETKHPRDEEGKFATKGASDWKKVGEKLGSNEGGTYEKDGKKYYVKFPANPDQGRTEVLSAQLAQLMDIKTTSPQKAIIGNKTAVVSEQQKLAKIDWSDPVHTITSMSATQRLQLARMYYHAKVAKNWDVLGIDASNIMMDANLDLVQMDTGGSFEFRAQGKHKDYGVDTGDTNLLDPKLPSGKVFTALMAADPAAFKIALGDLKNKVKFDGALDPLFDNSGLKNATALKFTFAQRLAQIMHVAPAPPLLAPLPAVKAATPMYQPTHANEEYALKKQLMAANPDKWPKKGEPGYLDSNQRLRAAAKLAYESDGATASRLIAASIKVPPPPVTQTSALEVSRYVSSSTALNQDLRTAQGDPEKMDVAYRARAKHLDQLFSQVRDYSMPVKVLRGMPNSVLPHGLKLGDTFVDHGYQSTSFSGVVAKSFGSGNTVLRVTLPKGFKFLAVPAFARAAKKMGHSVSHHAEAEAECILPRGVGYQVKKIEQEGGHRVLHVHAIFSAIQPPGTEWVSTRTAKAKAKQQQGSASGNIT